MLKYDQVITKVQKVKTKQRLKQNKKNKTIT